MRRCAGLQFDPELVEPFIECVLSCDANRNHAILKISKQAALNIGLQIESLAYAADHQSTDCLVAKAAILKQTASKNNVTQVADLADQLVQKAQEDTEQLELLQLTNELLELCRSTQTAYLSDENTAVAPRDSAPVVEGALLAVCAN